MQYVKALSHYKLLMDIFVNEVFFQSTFTILAVCSLAKYCIM